MICVRKHSRCEQNTNTYSFNPIFPLYGLCQGCPTFCEDWATSYQYKLWWATHLFLIIIHSNLMVKLYFNYIHLLITFFLVLQ
jgi:hypothetical protein